MDPFRERRAYLSFPGEPSGAVIAYTDCGRGIPMIFLHGFMSSRRPWVEIVFPHLSDAGRLIAIDLPGFGGSPPFAGPHTIERFAELTHRFANALGLRRYLLVGNSLGGTIALTCASRFPQRVCGVVAQGAVLHGADFPQPMRHVVGRMAQIVPSSGMKEKIVKVTFGIPLEVFLLTRVMSPADLRRLLPLLWRSSVDTFARFSVKSALETLDDLMRVDLTETLRALRVPTLLIDGDRVSYPPVRTLTRASALVPRQFRSVKIMRRAGHAAPFVDPASFARVLRSFLCSLLHHA